MKPEDIFKIQALCQEKRYKIVKGKKVFRCLVWRGWWIEDGKQIKCYIGKELPPYLEWMIEERFKLPGRKLWTWPRHKMGKREITQSHPPHIEI